MFGPLSKYTFTVKPGTQSSWAHLKFLLFGGFEINISPLSLCGKKLSVESDSIFVVAQFSFFLGVTVANQIHTSTHFW